MLLRAVPIYPSFHATRDNALLDVVRSPGLSPPCHSRIPEAHPQMMTADGKDVTALCCYSSGKALAAGVFVTIAATELASMKTISGLACPLLVTIRTGMNFR